MGIMNRKPNSKSLFETKLAKDSGEITRDKYWSGVKASLNHLSQLGALLAESESELSVGSTGLKLRYKISTGEDVQLWVDPNDTRGIGLSIISDGKYEEVLERLLLGFSARSRIFLDVGANAGFYTIAVATSNASILVHAFEPNPLVSKYFLRNLELNGLTDSRISLHEIGLSDREFDGELFVPQFTGTGGGSLKNLHPEEGDPTLFSIALTRLDALGLEGTDLIKIDVEGAELSVLRGGLETIKRGRPTIFIELLRKWMRPFGAHPNDVFDFLHQLGYKGYALTEQGPEDIEKVSDATPWTNFLFVHSTKGDVFSEVRATPPPFGI
jgi:FkbM family methyltransferase